MKLHVIKVLVRVVPLIVTRDVWNALSRVLFYSPARLYGGIPLGVGL
jgi:hypothetical protein